MLNFYNTPCSPFNNYKRMRRKLFQYSAGIHKPFNYDVISMETHHLKDLESDQYDPFIKLLFSTVSGLTAGTHRACAERTELSELKDVAHLPMCDGTK